MKSVAARVARTVNRALARSGAVLKDRYELRVLKTRRDVARALTAKDPRPAARGRSGPGLRSALDEAAAPASGDRPR
jgi:hypothetical protein